jgi:heavy metal sensor kinase
MTLRARLAILYTLFVGGILLLFGMAVYLAILSTLTNQVDEVLRQTAVLTIRGARAVEDLDSVIVQEMNLNTDALVQIWGQDGKLKTGSPGISDLKRPLDPNGLGAETPVYRNVTIGSNRLRVLSVPLVVSGNLRKVGVMQVGISMSLVDIIQQTLLTALLIGEILSMTIAAIAGWVVTQQAFKPLDVVTQTALQISRADDLSRRIPYDGPPSDEVGTLIHSFNQTLGRLETLFNSQRRFVADVGHELRTPLTVIKGNVDLIRKFRTIDDESLDSIESETDRLTRLVGDLLLLAQAESGKLPLARRTVELDTLVLEAMQTMRVLAKDRLTLKLGDIDQVLVCGDADRLKQVIVNLIGNAIKYTPSGGEVMVSLGKDKSQARLTVADDGPGIPVEDMPHIFERFYRGEKSRTRGRDGKGFGLGLSIAYWIVRNHNGIIDATAREPHGTIFTIRLPLASGNCVDETG